MVGDVMVKVHKDLTGLRFSRLIVIKQVDDHITAGGYRKAQWLCKCDCDGKEIVVIGDDLKSGNTKSCGCLKQEKTIERNYEKFKGNQYTIIDDYAIGTASNTDDEFLVSLCDLDRVKEITWCVILSHGIKRLY